MRSSMEACGDPASSRAYWITRQDLTNLAASIGVNITGNTAKNKNEVMSVAMYAEEMQSSDQVSMHYGWSLDKHSSELFLFSPDQAE